MIKIRYLKHSLSFKHWHVLLHNIVFNGLFMSANNFPARLLLCNSLIQNTKLEFSTKLNALNVWYIPTKDRQRHTIVILINEEEDVIDSTCYIWEDAKLLLFLVAKAIYFVNIHVYMNKSFTCVYLSNSCILLGRSP